MVPRMPQQSRANSIDLERQVALAELCKNLPADDHNPVANAELDDAHEHERKAALAEAAIARRPRLFAIHGIYHSGDDLLGWGIEFPNGKGAVFTGGDSVHHSTTADRVYQVMSTVGDVQLTWLDER